MMEEQDPRHLATGIAILFCIILAVSIVAGMVGYAIGKAS